MSRHDAYVGRFAPSPTGPLHFGSLVAALASFLDARHYGGRWLLRIEDLDPPRESKAAPGQIVAQLEAFGLSWDGEILYQSHRIEAYESALARLTAAGLTYPCTCSRQSIDGVYSGHCRARTFDGVDAEFAVRVRVPDSRLRMVDRVCGTLDWHLGRDVGDFIVKRKDKLFAYQLAVVVDDAFQGVTDVVRGSDLLDSTPRQMYLAQCLGFPAMRYCHFPVVVGHDGQKLSKQTRAPAVATTEPLPVLRKALKALGQPACEDASDVARLIAAAVANWDPGRIPRIDGIPYASL